MSRTLSRKYATPLRLDITPSRILGRCVLLIHGVPLLLLPLLQLNAGANTAIVMMLLTSLAVSLLPQAGKNPNRVRLLYWGNETSCRLELYSGRQLHCELGQQVFMTRWLVILYFNKADSGYRSLVLLPDMTDAEAFRRLRVRLQLEINKP